MVAKERGKVEGGEVVWNETCGRKGERPNWTLQYDPVGVVSGEAGMLSGKTLIRDNRRVQSRADG